jgi:probable addiction module antidote protein
MIDVRPMPWDVADYLHTDEEVAGYLEAAFEDGDPALIAAALGDVAKAWGMTRLAGQVGMSRPALYRALDRTGNPEFTTVLKVLKALGVRLVPVPTGKRAA